MEFQQVVEYVAAYQPPERKDITDSVLEGVKVIARNCIQSYSDMRDTGTLGANAENFHCNAYVQVMYITMFREVFEGAMADMFFSTFAAKFAIKHSAAPGLAPWKGPSASKGASRASSRDRCLRCGKVGHKASD